MKEMNKILVVEDELTNSILLKRLLTKAGYSVVTAHNGADALKLCEKENFDGVLTDWMMPQMDGIELIRRIREKINPIPFIVMITALVSEGAKNYALESGADDYIAKPIDIEELLTRVKDGLQRKQQSIPASIDKIPEREHNVIPPFIGVAIATSTGGPPTLIEIFRNIPNTLNAAFFIVQHGPPWMLETFTQRLQRETSLKVQLGNHEVKAEPGNIYIAPGDRHMRIDTKTYNITLDEGPKENFVRPAADPLFRSVAEAFGRFSIGVILTGLGRDGTLGAGQISSVQGTIIVQDPETAVAPSMPRTIIESSIPHKVFHLNELGKVISDTVIVLNQKLSEKIKSL